MSLEKVSIVTGVDYQGKISEPARNKLLQFMQGRKGQTIEITANEYRNTRSNQQNRYYWGVVVAMIRHALQETGTVASADEVHDFLKIEVGKMTKPIRSPSGNWVVVVDSTTRLKTDEFEQYIENCRAWAAEWLGVQIPLPNEPVQQFEMER